MTIKTNLKCTGCGKNIPDTAYDIETRRPKWFGRYSFCELIEWICVSCWDKGVRYKE